MKKSPKKSALSGRSPANKRKDIIDAAILLFARSGYDGVTFREIARHAGIPLATIHHYFQKKEVLYDVAVTRSFEFTAKRFVQVMKVDGDLEGQLLRLFEAHIELLSGGNPEIKLIDRALLDEHHASRAPNPAYEESRDNVRKLFEGLAERSDLSGSWMELSELFVGLVYGVVKFRTLHAQMLSGSVPSSPSRLATLMTKFFLAGLGMAAD